MLKKMILPTLAILSIGACAQNDLIEIEGKIRLKGSEPHSYLVIVDNKAHKTYKIINKNDFNLMQKQKQTVHLKAKAVKDAIGPGFPAEIEVVSVSP